MGKTMKKQKVFLQAITVRYSCGVSGQAYYTATAQAGRKRMTQDYSLNQQENSENCAKMFADHFGWLDNKRTVMFGGVIKNGDYVFVIYRKDLEK